MRVALVNPSWRFDGSIYFGCREPHLPLELGACAALLGRAGHATELFDGHMFGLDSAALAEAVAAFRPDMTVVTTAPTYLFWRCAPPELRAPREVLAALGDRGGVTVVVGPHGSSTPQAALVKLGCDLAIRGECEEVVVRLAEGGDPATTASVVWRDGTRVRVNGGPAAARFTDMPALHWPQAFVSRHAHHHHRFDRAAEGPGAEVEASRGCPYSCSFCAKIDFRDSYRRRDLAPLLQEIDGLIAQGVSYLYFIDEIFLPQRPLLDALSERRVEFGVQTRIDLWKPDMLDRLGAAGCVSIEAGVESLTTEGRASLDKNCRLSTDELAERLVYARRCVPFVQANLIRTATDDAATVAEWRERLQRGGVWANDPVPLFAYPSTPDYHKLWGAPDARAWERAHAHYLQEFAQFSEIQDGCPLSLAELEAECLPIGC